MIKPLVPESISEEYYQINENILSSFPKYRPPLDFFVYNDTIGQLLMYSKKGMRLSNEQVDELTRFCEAGNLFVSRTDHPVYAEHIVKQLDLILIDDDLKEGEIAEICLKALDLRITEFFDQPVKPVFDKLYSDIMVITEYLYLDPHRIKLFMRRLHQGEYSLAYHSINTFIVGLWLYLSGKKEPLARKDLDHLTLGLLLHDIGMAKVPSFILSKTIPLKPEEKEKILPHPLTGYKILQKLDLTYDPIRQSVMEHHERLDGSGYPQHTKELSSIGKLTAVADAFSAMIQKRPYAEAKDLVTAARELANDKTHFDFSYTSPLLTALLTDGFGQLHTDSPQPSA